LLINGLKQPENSLFPKFVHIFPENCNKIALLFRLNNIQAQRSQIKSRVFEGAIEVKKKFSTDIKAAFVLIITENIIALRNVIKTVIESISKSVGISRGQILKRSRKKA